MTTIYLFHPWIEASETRDTVLSLFGQWWDGDSGSPPIDGTIDDIGLLELSGIIPTSVKYAELPLG